MTAIITLAVGLLTGAAAQWIRCAAAVRDAEDAMHAAMAETVELRTALADDHRWARLVEQQRRPWDWESEAGA